MSQRVLLRLTIGIVTLFAASAVIFFGTELLPGDAAQAYLGSTATPQLLAQYRKEFGLNQSVLARYGEWLSGVLHGDLGKSVPSEEPVGTLISDKIRNSLVLGGVTLALLIPLSIVMGTLAAVYRGKAADHGVTSTTLMLISQPEFVIGTLLALTFGVWLGILPPVSLVDPSRSLFSQAKILILPVLTLLAVISAQTIRMVRACMIEVLDAEFIQMARLKGVPERRVLFKHALPNAMGPTIQILAQNIAWLFGGLVITETVFQFPGLGMTLTGAVAARDLPTVEAVALLITATYIVVNVLADIGVMVLNPRLRRAGERR
jgi:peptide/nickel transport system permease protein